MKLKLVSYVFLSFVLFIFGGCSSESFTKEENVDEFSNPYEFVGVLHNEGLLKIMLSENVVKFRNSHSKTRQSGSYAMIKDYIFRESVNFSLEKLEINSDELKSDLLKMQKNFYPIESTRMSLQEQSTVEPLWNNEYFQSCLKVINKECLDITNSEISERIKRVKTSISIIEKDIHASLTISDNDRIALLMGTTVLKHSFEFWIVNQDLLMGDDSTELTRGTRAMPDWLRKFYSGLEKAVGDDAMGAVGGAAWTIASGATAGSMVFGPGGAVTTIAAGAVGGAITGSILGAK